MLSFFVAGEGEKPMVTKEEDNHEENTVFESRLSKSEGYKKIIDLYSGDVYKTCFHLLKDKEEAMKCTVRVLVEFYDVYESMVDFDSKGNIVNEKQVTRYLIRMVLMKIKGSAGRSNEKDFENSTTLDED